MTTNLGPWPGNLYPPVRAHATANITPFTYYDGLSFLEVLEALRAWLRETLIPGLDGIIEIIDGMIQDALESVEIDLEAMREELNDALASIELTDTELRAYVDDVLQQVINNAIEVQDPVVAQLMADADSQTGSHIQRTYDRVYQVTSASQLDDAISRCANEGGGSIRVPVGAVIELSTVRHLPNEVRSVTVDGTIRLMGNSGAFIREGVSDTTRHAIISGAVSGSFILSMSDTTALSVGDMIVIMSHARFPSDRDTKNRYGYMRRITAKDSTTVRVDGALPRDLSGDMWVQKVELAEPLSIGGTGVITCDDAPNNRAAMLTFKLTRGVHVSGITLMDGGGQGVSIVHSTDFNIEPIIDNFIDDLGNKHVGYGVNVAGASRGGRVAGRISSCRHAVTTTTGNPTGNLIDGGEPENMVFEPITAKCYVAIDTHTPGWGITIRANDSGSEGVVTVRADNVTVESVTSYGLRYGAAVAVHSNLVIPPVVGAIKITNSFQGRAIAAGSPVDLVTTPSVFETGAGYSAYSKAAHVRGNGSVTSRSLTDSYTVSNLAHPEPIDDLRVVLDRGRYIVRATILYDATEDNYRARLFTSSVARARVHMMGIGPNGDLKMVGGDSESALLFGSGEFMKLEIYAQVILGERGTVVFMHSQGTASSGNVRTRAGSSIEIVKEQ